ncbi:NUDIX domain-containing protein [Duganella sp. Root1480D1]|uniref:NUDIX domain-containing protein n=1 Tax=Duganella sp. Root1480D1 TaxID=1736471 RepID=UPI00070F12C9|nr:NUDIX domain-containing protein [Duganella sp. Root1480D1]KQZ42598.1 ADP-ribose pyrophosphatase [Duganella sp. Root1480D1]
MEENVRIKSVKLLSDNWYVLKTTTFDLKRRDGRWQTMSRETYDRGNGAVALLYNSTRRTVLLTRQFRFPAYVNQHDGYLIEAPAGLLDEAHPEQRMHAELEEETGYKVEQLRPVFDVFMSPGSVTERLHFFVGEYHAGSKIGSGGGLEQEGEDIEVIEMDADKALAMTASGEIMDAKTIMLLQYLHLHLLPPRSMMILVAGPYRSGTGDDPARIAANVAAMESFVLPLYRKGHTPVLGEWLALPVLHAAGSQGVGDAVYEEIFHPHCERLLAHCDAVLRIGGASAGTDAMVAAARKRGLLVYHDLDQVPAV